MKSPALFRAGLALALCSLAALRAPAAMNVDSFSGPVTANEINSFKSHILTLQPVVWPNTGSMQNEYAQGASGEHIKAMGLMYEFTQDRAILDRMIYFCDVLLSQRNDILAAPYGQRTVWTGNIEAVWPGNNTGTATADAATADCIGHLAYCARLILQTPSIAGLTVGDGDPYGNGATYSARAATYVAEADFSVTSFILPDLLNLTNGNKYYYSAASPYQTGQNLPWNQQFMVSYPLQNLAACYAILGGNAAKVAQYDTIVQANLDWFFNSSTTKQTYTDSAGNTAYNWGYSPSQNGGEDSNHGALDVAGFYRAFLLGRYGITTAMMTPFANMFCDVMTRGPGSYAGRVDGTDGTGHGAPTTYIRAAYLLLADFRGDKYTYMMDESFDAGGTTSSDAAFSRFMWVKNKRYAGGGVTATAGDGLHTTALPSAQSGTFTAEFDWTTTASPINSLVALSSGTPSAYTGCAVIVRFNPSGVIDARNGGAYAAVSSISYSASTSYHFRLVVNVPTHTYSAYVTPSGGSELTIATNYAFRTEQAAVTNLTTWSVAVDPTPLGSTTVTNFTLPAAAQVSAPSFSPGGGTYTSAQSVTITSATSGASIRYTTNGTTPTATTGTVYSGPVAIGATATLKAIAYKSGMTDSTVTSATYTINLPTPAKFTIAGTAVTDSVHTGTYVPANTVDGNLGTRWAASGDGVWIQYDLSATRTVSYVKLAFYLGDARTYTFDVQVATSSSGPWTTKLSGVTNAANTALQTFDFADASARYVRIVGHLSSVDSYTNLTETEVWGY